METTLIVTVTSSASATATIRKAVAHALDWPSNYPDDVDTTEWMVSVTDAGSLLGKFETLQSSDPVKRDLELTCTVCGAVQCDVQNEDELPALLATVLGHDCPGEWTDETANELSRLEIEFGLAGGRGPELADEIDKLTARRDWAVRRNFPDGNYGPWG